MAAKRRLRNVRYMAGSGSDERPSPANHRQTRTRGGAAAAVSAIALAALAGSSALTAAIAGRDGSERPALGPNAPTGEPGGGATVRPGPVVDEVPVHRHRHTAVPILMYHVIADPPPGAPNPELYVSVSDFTDQMHWLGQNGYSAVTLHTVWNHWHGRAELPVHPIVVTFDDGTRSIALAAEPVLTARHWPGVLNLDLSNLDPPWGLSARRVRALVRRGWEVNSHTRTHADLTGLDAAHLKLEVHGSRIELRRRFHVPADFFCYPSGRFDDRVIAAVKAAGYLGAMTTIDGLARRDSPYELARVRVNRSDGQRGFAAKMVALIERP